MCSTFASIRATSSNQWVVHTVSLEFPQEYWSLVSFEDRPEFMYCFRIILGEETSFCSFVVVHSNDLMVYNSSFKTS